MPRKSEVEDEPERVVELVTENGLINAKLDRIIELLEPTLRNS